MNKKTKDPYPSLHAHHIKHLSRGGSNKISNLMALCERCHENVEGQGEVRLFA